MSSAEPSPARPRPLTDASYDPAKSPSARTTGFWNKIAEGYAKKPVANPEAYQRKLDALKTRLAPDQTVLDIGCGTGSLALEMAPLVKQVHAIDLSKEMIRIAERKATDAGQDNTSFYVSSIEGLAAFEQETFDVITAFNLLHLVDDLDDTLAKIHGMLKPGGSFVSSTSCLREGWMPYGLVIPIMQLFGRAPHVLSLHASDVLEGQERAGFVDVSRVRVNDDPGSVFTLARKPIDAGYR